MFWFVNGFFILFIHEGFYGGCALLFCCYSFWSMYWSHCRSHFFAIQSLGLIKKLFYFFFFFFFFFNFNLLASLSMKQVFKMMTSVALCFSLASLFRLCTVLFWIRNEVDRANKGRSTCQKFKCTLCNLTAYLMSLLYQSQW